MILPASGLGELPPAPQWIFLGVLSAMAAAVLYAAGLPAALFLGPMIGGVVAGVNNATIHVPRVPYYGAQAIMGCLIASGITPAILQAFAKEWPLFIAVVFSIIAASGALGWVMSRWRVMPGTASVWGSWPGGASAMVVMAAEFGADARLVAFMQYFRVVCVASLASVVAVIWGGADGASPASAFWFPHLQGKVFAETMLLALVCATVGRSLKIPSGPMLLTLFAGSALHVAGLIDFVLPKWLLAATYTVLGWNVGLSFTPAILVHALRALPKILLSIMVLIGFCGAIAYGLTKLLGIDALTAYLATSPGGMDSVAIIAASTHVDLPFVMALQTIRFLIIVAIGPPVARFIARHMGEEGE